MSRTSVACLLTAFALATLSCGDLGTGHDSAQTITSKASSASAVGTSETTPSSSSGVLASEIGASVISVTTTTYNGTYKPRNVLACWVENAAGTRVRTLGLYANKRMSYLSYWSKSGGTALDGVSGATRTAHGSLTFQWDGLDENGKALPYGSYLFRVQMTESDNSGKLLEIAADLGENALSLSNSGSGFSTFAVTYTP